MDDPTKLGLLLGAVLHDLHSPLNAVGLHLQRYMTRPKPRRDLFDEVAADALSSALRALRRLERLCADGERLAALLCGHSTPLHPETCSLLGTLRTIGFEQPALLERIDWSGFTSDLRLLADPLCFYRVLANLLGNAYKHGGLLMRVTGRRASVREEKAQPNGPPDCPLLHQCTWVGLITVWDDGPGIPADRLPDLFQPFARMSTTPGQRGLSLGLWLSRELVRAHGGELWLQQGETGTAFHALWPLSAEHPPPALEPRVTPPFRRRWPQPDAKIELRMGTTLAKAVRTVILETLEYCDGNRVSAAKTLGISRPTLYNRLRRYGL